MTRQTMRSMTLLILGMSALAWGCASTQSGSGPDTLNVTLTSLRERQAAGAVGSVHGHHFFGGPDALKQFKDSVVSLIPLAPALEAAVAEAHQDYLANRRSPLAPQTIRQRWAILDRYVAQVKRRGFGTLIRVTTTDAKEARFEFSDVPAGRWLLVAAATSPVSVTYWAVPIEVQAGWSLRQHLYEANVWLEGLN